MLVLIVAVVGGWWLWYFTSPSARLAAPGSLALLADGLPREQIWRQDFVFADMDGDDVQDLVTAPPRKSQEPWPHIFLRKGDRWEQACVDSARRGFPEKSEYIYGGIAVADFDGDGILDIILAMHETGIRLLKSRNKGPCGPWEEQHDLPEAVLQLRSRAVVAADMNRDGRVDLIMLSEAPPANTGFATRGITILFNEKTGWRLQDLPGSEGLFGDDIAIGEVNGDGIPDIAVGVLMDNRPQFVWLSDGADGWKATVEGMPQYVLAWSVQLADLDGDGHDELLFGAGGAPKRKNAGPRVYRWDGTQWQNASQGLPQVSAIAGVTAADLDGDGRKELVSAEMYTGIVRVYKQQKDGTWQEQLQVAVQDPQGLRNYKVRTWKDDSTKQEQVVANYAGGNSGRILAWAWR